MNPHLAYLTHLGLFTKTGTINSRVFEDAEKIGVIESYVNEYIHFRDNMSMSEKIYCLLHDISIQPICPVCGSEVVFRDRTYGYSTYCSTKCSSNSPNTKNMKIQTCLVKYGETHALKSQKIKEKQKQTNLDRYGAESVAQLDEIKLKKIRTNLLKYGETHPHKLSKTIDKQKQTNLERYGVSNIKQIHLIGLFDLLDDYHWLYDQYIVQNKTAASIANELEISDATIARYLTKHNIDIKFDNKYSDICIQWLNDLIEGGVEIIHAKNGGEYIIPNTRYKADGYCKETNTIYEFHGDYWHGNPNIYPPTFYNKISHLTMGELYDKTLKKENCIKELGYNLVVMWEADYLQNRRMLIKNT